jgi:alpha-amylase/alpha-mannosidase (GH57 family)
MSDKTRLKVVLCWHMHQPQYQDLLSGEYHLPWTYLHATKDYTDMAAHLRAVPGAKAVINFAPILLEQIDDYARQLHAYLTQGTPIRDALLAALANPVLPQESAARMSLAEACVRANEHRLIEPYPQFKLLADMVRWYRRHPEGLAYVNEGFLADLLVWYHLAWMGETTRRRDERVAKLMDKQSGYTLEDRRQLLQIICEQLSTMVEQYRALAEQGQVELSMTPYAHPIMPLLLDMHAARDAMPGVELPSGQYPGGEERVRWHIVEGIRTFERYFGFRPVGCWPSEGGVSAATLRVLGDYDFLWTASGETVLANSLKAVNGGEVDPTKRWLHAPYRLGGQGTACFFRDDGLSDAIGFKYADWHADDAVADFVHHLENIAGACAEKRQDCVVSVILDGENAWEYYPNNGYYFLNALYGRLADHPTIELTTFSAALDAVEPKPLPTLRAGSWVYGTFSTWIGDTDKNRGWEMLIDAKRVFDRLVAEGRLGGERLERATRQLAVCEGSDWCWWFGDYNPANSVSAFERLYRRHLANLYQIMGEAPPEYLAHSFTHGGGSPATGGVMRQGQQHA